MDQEDRLPTVMECPLSYSLSDESGQETAGGEALARLDAENLYVLPKFGEALLVPLRDIVTLAEDDYKIRLVLTSGERLRNELWLKDMLMHETLRKSGGEAELRL